MKKVEKPVLMPSALSAAVVLWSAVFLLYFFAFLVCYRQFGRLQQAKADLVSPRNASVATALFSLKTPAGWETVSVTNDAVTLRCRKGEPLPMVKVLARRDAAFSYRAVDGNPALYAQIVGRALEGEAYRPPNASPALLSVRTQEARPGVTSVQAVFALGQVRGLSVSFFVDDTLYLIVGAWQGGDARTETERRQKLLSLVRNLVLTEKPDRFRRPVVDTSRLTAEAHERCRRTIDRELALWKLYDAHVDHESAASLMPAITHFRLALTTASSIREERPLLESEDFRLYQRCLQMRRAELRDWFVLYDKYVATGDDKAALKQAEFIARHATLEEETLSRRCATEAQAAIKAKLQSNQNK